MTRAYVLFAGKVCELWRSCAQKDDKTINWQAYTAQNPHAVQHIHTCNARTDKQRPRTDSSRVVDGVDEGSAKETLRPAKWRLKPEGYCSHRQMPDAVPKARTMNGIRDDQSRTTTMSDLAFSKGWLTRAVLPPPGFPSSSLFLLDTLLWASVVCTPRRRPTYHTLHARCRCQLPRPPHAGCPHHQFTTIDLTYPDRVTSSRLTFSFHICSP